MLLKIFKSTLPAACLASSLITATHELIAQERMTAASVIADKMTVISKPSDCRCGPDAELDITVPKEDLLNAQASGMPIEIDVQRALLNSPNYWPDETVNPDPSCIKLSPNNIVTNFNQTALTFRVKGRVYENILHEQCILLETAPSV